ncbi:GNAT family N-acetyltransferase [Ramlibacter sp. PS3R-8]|uniref:GNAT family N-acetyltransferase n=1 Tax=Ramlibacter sp. PS3R-8 TaxID=3133437 RepID=UPI0030A63ECA
MARLSERTRYLRFFSTRKIAGEELRRCTELDASREGALVAVAQAEGQELQVGVARFVDLADAGNSELAVVVADEWQGLGVGRALMCAVIEAARRHGAGRLVGSALSENAAMLGLAREFGFRTWREPGSASVTELALNLSQQAIH